MKRAELKEIVKECLIEILSEGINISPSRQTESRAVSTARPPSRRSPLDERPSSRMVPNPNYKAAVKNAVSAITDDPLMQSLFADSAKTVQVQNQQGHSMGETPGQTGAPLVHMDPAARAMANVNPNDIFEGSDRWASLAFMPKGPTISGE